MPNTLLPNYFELFDLPIQYAVDDECLKERYHKLQSNFHPDRFLDSTEQEKRIALHYTALINEAYTVLKSPIKRAKYLLELQQIDLSEENVGHMAPEFLMQQMDLHERLAMLSNAVSQSAELVAIDADLQQQFSQLANEFIECYQNSNFLGAKKQFEKMQFIDKLISLVKQKNYALCD